MNRDLFVTLLALGVVALIIAEAFNVRGAGGLFFLYVIAICEWRRRWLKKPRWHWWNPLNIPDQFKKP